MKTLDNQIQLTLMQHIAEERAPMLYYSIAFAITAVIAAFFGFSGITTGAEPIGKLMFFIFLSIALISIAADAFYFS